MPDRPAEQSFVDISVGTDDQGRASIKVEDNGCGIPAENLPHVFDPFFSTKPVGSGMGLGLSVCFGVVQALKGELTVTSELGLGTAFTISLPLAPAGDPSLVAPAPPVDGATGGGPGRARVLVVDDEPAILLLFERILGGEHDVTVEANSRRALQRIECGERFDAIFLDVMMAQLSGPQLLEWILRLDPGAAAKIVMVTGGAATPAAEAFLSATTLPVLAKPFQVADLLLLVREVTRAAPG